MIFICLYCESTLTDLNLANTLAQSPLIVDPYFSKGSYFTNPTTPPPPLRPNKPTRGFSLGIFKTTYPKKRLKKDKIVI